VLWSEALIGWLEKIATDGSQLGTEHSSDKTFRYFELNDRQPSLLTIKK